MEGVNDRRLCAGCGEAIGVYESAWVEHPDDGSMHPSSWLNLDERVRAAAPRMWHSACVIEDFPPGT